MTDKSNETPAKDSPDMERIPIIDTTEARRLLREFLEEVQLREIVEDLNNGLVPPTGRA